jgi:hypothetical protein
VGAALKMDAIGWWIEEAWIAPRQAADMITLWVSWDTTREHVIADFDTSLDLEGGYRFAGAAPYPCPVVIHVHNHTTTGELTYRSGAYLYHFQRDGEDPVEILVVSSFVDNDGEMVVLACMPRSIIPLWTAFSNECARRAGSLVPDVKVVVIGGRSESFVPTVRWDEIILPEKLKSDLLEDVQSFFSKGIGIYNRLNLKPFRKLLLAGVPGTGKTMLCSALASWAIEQQYLVIYISSSDRHGATFGKIQHALDIAWRSNHQTLIILEELDAYLHEEEKAQVLNVLDGSEAIISEKGAMLIATTNYPEAIDERVLKRPGRLDRIFIVPETRHAEEAEQMLRQYLGDMWRAEHRAVAQHLVGYPGAFIREVAVYALTQVAYEDLSELPLEVLLRSFQGLKEQIDAKEDFLTQRSKRRMGLGGDLLHNGRHSDYGD